MLNMCKKWIRQSVRTLFRCSATWLRGKTTSPLNSWESRCKRLKRTKISNISILYLRTDYNCAMSRASLILKFNWSTLSAGESESDSNMIKYCVNSKKWYWRCSARGHDGSFQAPGGSTEKLEAGVKRLRVAGQVLQTVVAETMQVINTKTNTIIDTNTNTKTIKERSTSQTVVARPLQNNLKLITSLWTGKDMV